MGLIKDIIVKTITVIIILGIITGILFVAKYILNFLAKHWIITSIIGILIFITLGYLIKKGKIGLSTKNWKDIEQLRKVYYRSSMLYWIITMFIIILSKLAPVFKVMLGILSVMSFITIMSESKWQKEEWKKQREEEKQQKKLTEHFKNEEINKRKEEMKTGTAITQTMEDMEKRNENKER